MLAKVTIFFCDVHACSNQYNTCPTPQFPNSSLVPSGDKLVCTCMQTLKKRLYCFNHRVGFAWLMLVSEANWCALVPSLHRESTDSLIHIWKIPIRRTSVGLAHARPNYGCINLGIFVYLYKIWSKCLKLGRYTLKIRTNQARLKFCKKEWDKNLKDNMHACLIPRPLCVHALLSKASVAVKLMKQMQGQPYRS